MRHENKKLVSAIVVRQVTLNFNNDRNLFLFDYLYDPDFKKNLVYVSCLVEQGFTVQFNSSVFIKSSSSIICSGESLNGLYFLSSMMLII